MSVFELVDDDTDLTTLLEPVAAAVPLVEALFDSVHHPRGRTGEWIRSGLTLRHHGQLDAATASRLQTEISASLVGKDVKRNTATVAREIAQAAGTRGFGGPLRSEVATAHDEHGNLVGLAAWEHGDGITHGRGLATLGHGKGAARALVELRAVSAAERGNAVEIGADPGSEGFHEHMGAQRVDGNRYRFHPDVVRKQAARARAAMGDGLREAAVHFDEKHHPRWPKGTPRGGQFIRVGQSFGLKGHQYEVAHVVRGKIYAHLKGGKQAQTIEVHTTKTGGFAAAHPAEVHIAKIEAPTPTSVKGGKGQESTVTAISPYVDHASHDPSIPIPAGSSVTPEQWKRFGKIDQEHYTELQDRFGKWEPGAAQELVNKSYTDFSDQLKKTAGDASGAEAVSVVKSGYSGQYGMSSGFSLSLISPILSKLGLGHGSELPAKAHDSRERAMVLQGEHKAAVQWDLYNRTHSPDIFSVHKVRNPSAQDTAMWQKNYIDGPKRIFSGLSQSFWYRPKFFGDTGVSTPLAIRHILMSSYSAKPVNSGFAEGKPGQTGAELEISVPEQMVLDGRSTAFTYSKPSSNGHKLSEGAMRWLTKETMHPVGGFIQDMLRDHFTKGAELPEIPAGAHVEMDGAGKAWIDPEPVAWHGISKRAVAKSTGNNLNVGDHFLKGGKSYQVTSVTENGTATGKVMGGTTEAKVAAHEEVEHAQPIATAGLSAGDFVMGLQGARYVVVSDPSEPEYGLRYVELTDNGPTNNAYTLKAGGVRQFYRLDGHYEPKPVEVAGGPAFQPEGWTAGEADARFVSKLSPGEKFKVHNEFYEVVQQLPGTGKAQVRDLVSGKLGKINTDYKTKTLVTKAGYTPPAGTTITPPSGEAAIVQAAPPEPGDFMAVNGEKWEVLGLAKSGPDKGKVKLKRPGKPGLMHYAVGDPALQNLHRPSDHVIGEKAKLRDIPVGEKFHMGAGAKQKPYEVVSHGGPGKKSVVLDLSTGQKHEVSRNASYSKLVAPTAEAPGGGPVHAPEPAKHTPKGPGSPHDPTGYVLSSETVQAGDLPDGAKFQTGSGDQYQKVGGLSGDYIEVANLLTGEQKSMLKLQPAQHLVPKSETVTPHPQLSKGDLTTIEKLSPGDQFSYSDGSTGVVALVSLPADGSPPLVASVDASGTTGAPYPLSGSQSDTVQFHKHAADPGWWQTNAAANAGLTQQDPAGMPSAESAGFVGYGSAYATGAKEKNGFSGKHHRVSEMAPGTVFRDKQGKLWQVKQSGAHPVITDGAQNYSVNGQLRGRASTTMGELPGGDASPALGTVADGPKAGMQKAMNPNVAGLQMHQLKKNDLFTYSPDGPIHAVVEHQGDGMKAIDVTSGNGKWVPNDFAPSHVALAEAPPAPASALTPDQILQTAHALMSPNTAGATAASLHPDDLLDGPPKSFSSQRAVFKVSAITPEGKIQAYDIVNGALHTFDPGYKPKAVWMGNPLPPAEPDPVIPTYDGIKLEVGGGAGGSTGAKIATAPDGTKYLLKTYSGNQDRVATELAANAIYRAMGIKVPDAGTYTMTDGSTALAYPLLDGEPHKITSPSEVIGQGFMTDALVANWDFIGLVDDNILWGPDGTPFRVDQGGTLQYRAQGAKKDFGPIPSEVWSMLSGGGQGVGKVSVTTEQKQAQAQAIADTLTPGLIDEILHTAPFKDKAMRNEVGDALKARVDWMAAYAHGDVLEPGQAAAPKPKPPPVAPSGPTLGEGISPNSGYLTLAQLAPGEVFQMHDSTALYQVQNQPSGTGTVAAKVISAGMDFGGDVGATHHLQAHKSPAGIGQPENVPGADPEGPPITPQPSDLPLSSFVEPKPTPKPGELKPDIKAPSDPLQAALAASLAAMGVSSDSPAGIKALGNVPAVALQAQQLTLDQLKAKYGTLSALDYLPAAGKPFVPFKSAWGTGGKYKHPRVGELKFGEVFHDKTGGEWTYVGPHSADASVVQGEHGDPAILLNDYRVKRKADA